MAGGKRIRDCDGDENAENKTYGWRSRKYDSHRFLESSVLRNNSLFLFRCVCFFDVLELILCRSNELKLLHDFREIASSRAPQPKFGLSNVSNLLLFIFVLLVVATARRAESVLFSLLRKSSRRIERFRGTQ